MVRENKQTEKPLLQLFSKRKKKIHISQLGGTVQREGAAAGGAVTGGNLRAIIF